MTGFLAGGGSGALAAFLIGWPIWPDPPGVTVPTGIGIAAFLIGGALGSSISRNVA